MKPTILSATIVAITLAVCTASADPVPLFDGKTFDYTEKDPEIPTDGIIAIQIHGRMQALIAYKDITIEQLPAGK